MGFQRIFRGSPFSSEALQICSGLPMPCIITPLQRSSIHWYVVFTDVLLQSGRKELPYLEADVMYYIHVVQ